MLALLLVVLASRTTCVLSFNFKENSPTYVPRRCFLARSPGPCRASIRSWYFNPNTGHCEAFVYGGCGGNINRFNTKSKCDKSCTCATPPETGPCRGHIRRWFYSPADGCCRPFIYGGCGGNSNNYPTWTDCSNVCGYPTADSSWWSWGAQWGFGPGGQGSQTVNNTYSKDDFMRDWMFWMLLSDGEGFEMEDLAAIIGQAHTLNMSKSLASSKYDQEAIPGLGHFGEMFWNGEGQMTSGMANWGPTYRTKPGSFTPLGHVGSIENIIGTDAQGARINGLGVWDQLAAHGFGGDGRAGWGSGSSVFGNMAGGGTGGRQVGEMYRQEPVRDVGMSGQKIDRVSGMVGQGQSSRGPTQGQIWYEGGWNKEHSSWNSRDGLTSSSASSGWRSNQQGSTGFDSVMEMLFLISKLGRGMLDKSLLTDLGKRFGAVGPTGEVDVNLLATRMVTSLQGPKAAANLAKLKGIAHDVGALDFNGNIIIPLLITGIAEKFSTQEFGSRKFGDFPSLDEYKWLGPQKDGVGLKSVARLGSKDGAKSQGSVGRISGAVMGSGPSGSMFAGSRYKPISSNLDLRKIVGRGAGGLFGTSGQSAGAGLTRTGSEDRGRATGGLSGAAGASGLSGGLGTDGLSGALGTGGLSEGLGTGGLSGALGRGRFVRNIDASQAVGSKPLGTCGKK